jgi:hypothetical protein
MKDVDGRAQPLRESFIARLLEMLNLTLKNGQNIGGRLADLQLGCQRMSEKIFPRLLLIHFKGGINYSL